MCLSTQWYWFAETINDRSGKAMPHCFTKIMFFVVSDSYPTIWKGGQGVSSCLQSTYFLTSDALPIDFLENWFSYILLVTSVSQFNGCYFYFRAELCINHNQTRARKINTKTSNLIIRNTTIHYAFYCENYHVNKHMPSFLSFYASPCVDFG
jgi:hypothetical protein